MSWLTRLFGSTKTLDKVVDAAVSAGDKIWHTDEEKADDRHRMQEWYLKLLDSMQPFNVAMRVLAFSVAFMWGVHLMASTSMHIASFFTCDHKVSSSGDVSTVGVCRAEYAADKISKQMVDHINDPFGLVMIFYFGAAGVNGAIRTYNNKQK